MDEELRHKLSSKRRSIMLGKQLKEFDEVLSEIIGIRSIAYSDNLLSQIGEIEIKTYDGTNKNFGDIEKARQETLQISSSPYSKIPVDSSNDVILDWVESSIAQTSIQSPWHLSMSGFHDLGWVQIESDDFTKSLRSMWEKLAPQDLYLVDRNLSSIMVFFVEEYYIEAHWKVIN
jgi:hypothetical protein